jgi:hypothetical protein
MYTLHFHLHFINVHSLNMYRALLAHLQETLHGRRFGDYCVCLEIWVGLGVWEGWVQPTTTTAHNSHQTCVPVVSPEDGQVMPETCRGFEPY